MNNMNKPSKEKKQDSKEEKNLDFIYQDIEEKLKSSLATKVEISSKGDGTGKIEIEFYSNDDLERLMDIFTK